MTALNPFKATFDDDMADHAISKRHCTVSEALSVGRRMKVDNNLHGVSET